MHVPVMSVAASTRITPVPVKVQHVQSDPATAGWVEKTQALRHRQQRAQERLLHVKRDSHKQKSAMPKDLPPRAKSTNSKPSKPQTRTLKHNVSELHHTNSETALVDRMKNLNLRGGGSAHSNASSQSRVPRVRSTGSGCKSVDDIARLIKDNKAKNIVVMCGAGISTNSGIPDFRSPGTGLYDNLKQYNIPYPESMFDMDYFESNPKPFFTLSKELYPIGRYRPNYVHYFLRMLHEKGVLLRIYTQNIDGLERMAGIPTQKVVEAHGTFYTSSCVRCNEPYNPEMIRKIIFNNKIPRCHKNRCLGLIKPDIVFFGEDMPRKFYYYLKDFPQADLLLVMGTSLEVDPFAGIVDSVRMYVPRVLFNRCVVGPFKRRKRANDVAAKGDMVQQLQKFAKLLGWTSELETLMQEAEEKALNQSTADIHPAFSSSDLDTEDLNAAGIVAHPTSHPNSNKSTATTTTHSAKAAAQAAIAATKHIFTSTPSNRLYTNHNRTTAGVNNHSVRAPVPPDIISVAKMPGYNNTYHHHSSLSSSRSANSSTNHKKPLQTTNLKSLLPKLTGGGKTFPAFHAQSKMYRTSNDDKTEEGYFFNSSALVAPTSRGGQSDSEEDDESDDTDSSDD